MLSMRISQAGPSKLPASLLGARTIALTLVLLASACKMLGFGPGSVDVTIKGGGVTDIRYMAVIVAPADIFKGTEDSLVAKELILKQDDFTSLYQFEVEQKDRGVSVFVAQEPENELKDLIEITPSKENLSLELSISRKIKETHDGQTVGILIRHSDLWVVIEITAEAMERSEISIDLKKQLDKQGA
ncbi:MAG: hypothetical protein ACI841_003011 [Planctomycetota bacterium]|jgi:hypothetical protein